MVDMYFLAQISDQAAASVGAILAFLGFGMLTVSSLSRSCCNIATQYLGAGKKQDANHVFTIAIALSLIVGLAWSLLLILFSETIAVALGLDSDLVILAAAYMPIIGWGFAFFSIRRALASIMESYGHTRDNLLSSIVLNLMNLGLNALFLIQFGDGPDTTSIQLIALATVSSWFTGLLLSIGLAYRRKLLHGLGWIEKEKIRSYLVQIFRIAIPAIAEPMAYQGSRVAVTMFIVSMGSMALATNVYVGQALTFVILIAVAVSQGSSVLIANSVGAKDFSNANDILWKSLGLATVSTIFVTFWLIVFYRPVFGLLTSDESIMSLARDILLLSLVSDLGRCMNVVVGANLRATGDAVFNSTTGMIVMWCIAVPLAYFFGIVLDFGLMGIFMANAVDEAIRGLICIYRWRQNIWQSSGINRQLATS